MILGDLAASVSHHEAGHVLGAHHGAIPLLFPAPGATRVKLLLIPGSPECSL